MGVKLGGGRGGRGGFRDINVTPLVDVMLVLLVVFMVTAPLLTTGLRIDLPEVKAAQTPVKDARLLVTVTKDERILFGEKDVTGRIDQALKEAGSSLDQAVRVHYLFPDRHDFEPCWPVFARWLGQSRPAATVIIAGLLDDRMKLEIEITARVGGGTVA